MSRIKDMTQGSPAKLLLAFTVPLVLGNLGQQFYMIVDAIIVGQGVGIKALAGADPGICYKDRPSFWRRKPGPYPKICFHVGAALSADRYYPDCCGTSDHPSGADSVKNAGRYFRGSTVLSVYNVFRNADRHGL